MLSLICAILGSCILVTQCVMEICPQYWLHLLTVPWLYHHQAFPSGTETGVRGQWLSSPVRRCLRRTRCPEHPASVLFTLSSSLGSSMEFPKKRQGGGSGKYMNNTEHWADVARKEVRCTEACTRESCSLLW